MEQSSLRTVARATAPADPSAPDTAGVPRDDGGLALLLRLHPRELVVHEDGRLHALDPVAEVQALVLAVGVAERVLHAHQDARSAAEEIGEGAHEADRAAGPDHG